MALTTQQRQASVTPRLAVLCNLRANSGEGLLLTARFLELWGSASQSEPEAGLCPWGFGCGGRCASKLLRSSVLNAEMILSAGK